MDDKAILHKIQEALACLSLHTIEREPPKNVVTNMIVNSLVAAGCLKDVEEELKDRLEE
jgi:hypothetical protein